MKKFVLVVKQISKIDNKLIYVKPIRSDSELYVKYTILNFIHKHNITLNDIKVFDMATGDEYSVYSLCS